MLNLTKKTGIFYHQGIDTYHIGPGISKSGLCKLDESAADYEYHYILGNRKPETPSMTLGKAFHAIMDGSFEKEYAIVPDSLRRNTKAWKAEEEKHKGKTLVKEKDVGISLDMAQAVKKSGHSKTLLSDGNFEVSYYWVDPITKLLCKCRPDFISSDLMTVVDFKTARRVGKEGFRYDATTNHYYVSAAFTLQGIEAVTGVRPSQYIYMAIRNYPPHLIKAHKAKGEEIRKGNAFIFKNLLTLKECRDTGTWPGLSEDIDELGLSYQARRELEEYEKEEQQFNYLIG